MLTIDQEREWQSEGANVDINKKQWKFQNMKLFIWGEYWEGVVWIEDVWGLWGCQTGTQRKDRAEIS